MVGHSLLNWSVSDHDLLNRSVSEERNHSNGESQSVEPVSIRSWSVSEKLGQREGLALDSPMFYGSAPDI